MLYDDGQKKQREETKETTKLLNALFVGVCKVLYQTYRAKLTEQITLYLCDDALENATFRDILFQSLLEAAAISNCCKLTIEGK